MLCAPGWRNASRIHFRARSADVRSGVTIRALAVCGALLAWAAPVVSAQTPAPSVQTSTAVDYSTARLARKLLATRASGPISLDGVLDEPAWRGAPVATG